MKRIIVTLIAALTVTAASMAQTDNERRERPSKEEMAKHRTEAMVKKYGLDASQQEKLLALNTKYADKMKPMHPRRHHGPHPEAVHPDDNDRPVPPANDGQDMEKKRKEMKETQEAYEKELKGIMTEEQFEKYKKERLEMRRGPRAHHGPHHHGARPQE